jgi:23S rRNA (guanine745-N1)-methyltransferase
MLGRGIEPFPPEMVRAAVACSRPDHLHAESEARFPVSGRGGRAFFRCPVCTRSLELVDRRVLYCEAGHAFDMARDGYVNLLMSQHRRSQHPGYSREMIDARRQFLQRGYYEPLADALASLILASIAEARDTVILDVGCGEGYYLRALGAAWTRTAAQTECARVGVDISKRAVQLAARSDPDGRYAVASVYRIPAHDRSVDTAFAHFSPMSWEELARVVRPGGHIVIGRPGREHLQSLKALLYHGAREPDASAPPLPPQLQHLATERVTYDVRPRGTDDLHLLLAMTPYRWTGAVRRATFDISVEAPSIDVDVIFEVWRCRG